MAADTPAADAPPVAAPGLPRLLRPLDNALAVLACTATALVVVVVTVEVFFRYVLSSSIFFANELARLMFVWGIFLGFPLALSRGRHVGIQLVDAVVSPRIGRQVIRIGALLGAGLLGFMAWKTVDVMLFNWDQRMNTMPVTAGLFYVPIVTGLAVGSLYLLVLAAHGVRALVDDGGGDPIE